MKRKKLNTKELFLPMIIRKIMQLKMAHSIREAKLKSTENNLIIQKIVSKVVENVSIKNMIKNNSKTL